VAWWLVDPLALYLVSTMTRTSLFVPRYMYLALPGAALIACAMARLFIPGRLWKPVAACLGCTVLIFGGHWNRIWPTHQNSDWRTASQRLRDWSGNEDIPVICPSPFIEARAPVWNPNYPVSGFLYSHLAVYPMAGHVYPFPFESSPEAAAFARQLTAGALAKAGRFALFGGDRSVRFWRDWFAAQPEFSAWNNEVLGLYGDVEIVGFIRKLSQKP
jgi:hypothetical protein